MIVEYFKNKFTKLQSKANGSKLIFAIAIANAFGVAYTASWFLSYHSWIYLGTFEKLHPALFEASIHFPNIYLMIICLTCLDKITHGMLLGVFYSRFIPHLDNPSYCYFLIFFLIHLCLEKQ